MKSPLDVGTLDSRRFISAVVNTADNPPALVSANASLIFTSARRPAPATANRNSRI
jgi:hypothetical protein